MLIDRQSKELAKYGAGLSKERMDAILSQTRVAYSKQLFDQGPAAVSQRCSTYKSWTESPSADPEATHADWVAKMRQYAAK